MSINQHLAEKIHAALKAHFPHDTVDVSPSGVGSNLHIVVVSREFDGMTEATKLDHVTQLLLDAGLTNEELALVTLIMPYAPAELR